MILFFCLIQTLFVVLTHQTDFCRNPSATIEHVEEVAAAGAYELTEGPHWDIERQSLYFVNIYGCSIFRYDYAGDATYMALVGEFYIDEILNMKRNQKYRFRGT